jgi:hypothetical protein
LILPLLCSCRAKSSWCFLIGDFCAALTAGTSNHEGGAAIDVPAHDYWRAALTDAGFTWFGANDVVHFDFHGATVLSRENLRAFQTIWNQHNPASPLTEDGIYGAKTAAALHAAPCGGW